MASLPFFASRPISRLLQCASERTHLVIHKLRAATWLSRETSRGGLSHDTAGHCRCWRCAQLHVLWPTSRCCLCCCRSALGRGCHQPCRAGPPCSWSSSRWYASPHASIVIVLMCMAGDGARTWCALRITCRPGIVSRDATRSRTRFLPVGALLHPRGVYAHWH